MKVNTGWLWNYGFSYWNDLVKPLPDEVRFCRDYPVHSEPLIDMLTANLEDGK